MNSYALRYLPVCRPSSPAPEPSSASVRRPTVRPSASGLRAGRRRNSSIRLSCCSVSPRVGTTDCTPAAACALWSTSCSRRPVGENPRKLGTHFSLGIPTVPLSEMGIPTQRADRTHGHAARGRQLGGTRRTSTGTGVAPPSSAGTRGRGVTGLESWCLEA